MKLNHEKEAKLTISVCHNYLSKGTCEQEARHFLREGIVHGMSEKQLARELFFHAVMYYYCDRTGKFPKWKEHANPINIHDGGDTRLRRMIYAVFWLLKSDK